VTRRPGRWAAPRLRLRRWIDPFVVAIVAALLVGVVVPMPDGVRGVLDAGADGAVALLFLLYGARLPVRDIARSLANWRLQGGLLVATFVAFPLLGAGVSLLAGPVLGGGLAAGLLCLSLLPSTVNSSVAFTSVGRGDVAGAICGATVSNVLGMLLTPLLILGLLSGGGLGRLTGGAGDGVAVGTGGITTVLLQLLLPFVVGQLAQPWVGDRVRGHPRLTQAVDRGTILLIVVTAVSGATAQGVWSGTTAWTLLALVAASGVLLAGMLVLTWWGGRALRLSRAENVTLVLCGSMKSLATGLPMAAALLPAASLGVVAIPLVVFHQLQLVVCSVLARRLGAAAGPS
jgi:solute carrier family 10 (sodium/bile acid cotransporter), member 7